MEVVAVPEVFGVGVEVQFLEALAPVDLAVQLFLLVDQVQQVLQEVVGLAAEGRQRGVLQQHLHHVLAGHVPQVVGWDARDAAGQRLEERQALREHLFSLLQEEDIDDVQDVGVVVGGFDIASNSFYFLGSAAWQDALVGLGDQQPSN